ncbi:hypothetical protein SCLCIDRAFT_143067, partial [Scleroderma citrinum Foug A]
MSSSSGSNRSLRSRGPPVSDVLAESTQKKPRAKWTTQEEHELLAFLKQQLPAAGDGVNFLKKHFWDATNRLKTVFPVQHGGEKNARSCQSKWTSLKEDYLLVAILKTNSGFDWNDDTGTKFGKDDTTWTDFAATRPKHINYFRTHGFLHFNIIADMMPSHSKGTYVF